MGDLITVNYSSHAPQEHLSQTFEVQWLEELSSWNYCSGRVAFRLRVSIRPGLRVNLTDMFLRYMLKIPDL